MVISADRKYLSPVLRGYCRSDQKGLQMSLTLSKQIKKKHVNIHFCGLLLFGTAWPCTLPE